MVVGVVLDPSRDELFVAAKGQGAWLASPAGERRLQTSAATSLEQALLSTGFPPDLRGQERTLEWWRHFSLRTRSLRRTGSTALNLAYVAAGRFDGYWAFDNHPWDVAGGMVLVQEAGGRVTNVDGTPFDPYTPNGLASNGPLHPVLLQALREGP
jgi:myo-inositol-1(or 4)-monophosphatase